MLCLCIFGVELSKAIFVFKISKLKFAKMQNFAEETKNCKFGTKNALFWVFLG